MGALSQVDFLNVGDLGREQDQLGRALVLWHIDSGRSLDELEREPIGVRDRALLESRIETLGPAAESYVECPECGEALEFELDLRDFLIDNGNGEAPQPVVHHRGVDVRFRLPTTIDLRAVRATNDPAAALIDRCVDLQAHPDFDAADRVFRVAVEAAMQSCDPQADIEIKLECAACSNAWIARFDIGTFYWREIEIGAQRLVRDIHTIARAYGWSQAEVLELSPDRRRRYIEMIAD